MLQLSLSSSQKVHILIIYRLCGFHYGLNAYLPLQKVIDVSFSTAATVAHGVYGEDSRFL